MKVPYGFVVGNKWYFRCLDCGSIVRVNKPFVGSLHLCAVRTGAAGADDSDGSAR